MLQIVHTGLVVIGGLIALIAILLALPASRLRDFLNPIIGRGGKADQDEPLSGEHFRHRESSNH